MMRNRELSDAPSFYVFLRAKNKKKIGNKNKSLKRHKKNQTNA